MNERQNKQMSPLFSCTLPWVAILLIMVFNISCRPEGRETLNAEPVKLSLHPERWSRFGRHDGYVIGNGEMYAIGGLGRVLSRSGKSSLTAEPVSLSRLAWVVGPYYTIGNLGYGWEVLPVVNGREQAWRREELIHPEGEKPFWGVRAANRDLEMEVIDVLQPDAPVLLRLLHIRRAEGRPAAEVSLRLPVYADERNAEYTMFNGLEVDSGQVDRWREFCGPNLRPRPSIRQEQLLTVDPAEPVILTRGAPRALWQEISTIVPPDEEYRQLFPPRALATTATIAGATGSVKAGQQGLLVDLGRLPAGEERTVAVWIVTATAERDATPAARRLLADWRARDPEEVVRESRRQLPPLAIRRTDGVADPLINILRATGDLCRTGQSASGGVWAQPYMYPMYYVRDQYGPFRRFIAGGDYQRAYRVLQFYVAMQNREGIQNAHDGRLTPPDPELWLPEANAADGRWKRAEVPSYIILMARDYFLATADLEGLRPFYPRLAYNLRIQAFSENGIQPWATDESFTNTEQTRPRFADEMTDSQLLFIGAAEFMADLAGRMGYTDDAAAFRERANSARAALMQRMWLPAAGYFAFARSAAGDSIDVRPAFDALLRWYWLELGKPDDSVATGNLSAVAAHLLEPLRVVPEYQWCTGMDPGYL